MGTVRAQWDVSAWAEQQAVRETMVFLHSHGVGLEDEAIIVTFRPHPLLPLDDCLHAKSRLLRKW